MPLKNQIGLQLPGPKLLQSFNISLAEIRRIIGDFHSEMKRGLSGSKSSLKMIPAYVDTAGGNEKGKFIALDLGGTNFRILELELKGRGRISKLSERKFVLKKELTCGTQILLFDFIAECIKKFIKETGGSRQEHSIGFTFSFPVRQTGIASGILVKWTKEFSVSNSRGKDVVAMLKQALQRRGVGNVRIAALVNDTVGTLVCRSYKDPYCDIGIILGTGTNACYREDIRKIVKAKAQSKSGKMIINIEWGDFNKLPRTVYDRIIDRRSTNPGEQVLEKMVSGMYLGRIAEVIIEDFIKTKRLFKQAKKSRGSLHWLSSADMSMIENDSSAQLTEISALLKKAGLQSSLADRLLLKKICNSVSTRAAYVSAAALSAVITKIDPRLSHKHTVAVDGSVYEKYAGFASKMGFVLSQIFGRQSRKIKMALTKDGSGMGAAIIAAVAM